MNKFSAWIKDYTYMISKGALMYFIHTTPEHYLGHVKDGKVPVVILPGLSARWAFYKPMADHISLLGHPVYVIPKLGNNLDIIVSSAEKVAQFIEENNLKNVVIVAHSKGGLIGKYLLLKKNGGRKILGLIAIATPFHGSSVGRFIPHSSFKELSDNSEIVHFLKNHPEVNNKIVSIFPSYDNHVWHSKGSYLEGAMQNIKVAIAGHHIVLNDKEVWNKVEEWIEKITKE